MTKPGLIWALTVAIFSLFLGVQSVAAQTPDDLAKAISDTQREAMEQVVVLMKDRPAPAELQPKLAQLKEDTIKKMVEIGAKREAFSPDDRKIVDGLVEKAHGQLPSDLVTAFTEGNAHYLELDKDLSKLIMDFFLIPQYALFDVLKQYLPEEAERLGIK